MHVVDTRRCVYIRCYLNDIETEIATYIERQFLKTLKGYNTIELCNVEMIKRYHSFQEFYFADGKEKLK
jgi:hypothetical protein